MHSGSQQDARNDPHFPTLLELYLAKPSHQGQCPGFHMFFCCSVVAHTPTACRAVSLHQAAASLGETGKVCLSSAQLSAWPQAPQRLPVICWKEQMLTSGMLIVTRAPYHLIQGSRLYFVHSP